MEALLQPFVEKMFRLKPPGTRLTPVVCVSVLRKKYAAELDGKVDWSAASPVVEAIIGRLDGASGDDSDDSDSDSSDSDDSEEGSSEEGSSEEGSSEEDSDFSGDDSDDDSGAEESAAEEPPLKKAKADEAELESDAHTTAMAKFLATLPVSVRAQGKGEAAADYRRTVIDPAFAKHGLEAGDLSKDAKKRFKLRRELADLQGEVDLSLEKTARRGRPTFGEKPTVASTASAPKPRVDNSLFDEE